MKKKIKIIDEEYEVCSNACTPFIYKKKFNRGFMSDLQVLSELNTLRLEKTKEFEEKGFKDEELESAVSGALLGKLDDFFMVVTQMAYILILGANSNFKSYEEWLSEKESLNIGDDWIAEVTEIAVNSFLGQGT